MVEPLVQTRTPDTHHDAIEPTPEMARRNAIFAWALLGLFLLLFGGTFAVGLVYLWLD
jgi:hypothetical protein